MESPTNERVFWRNWLNHQWIHLQIICKIFFDDWIHRRLAPLAIAEKHRQWHARRTKLVISWNLLGFSLNSFENSYTMWILCFVTEIFSLSLFSRSFNCCWLCRMNFSLVAIFQLGKSFTAFPLDSMWSEWNRNDDLANGLVRISGEALRRSTRKSGVNLPTTEWQMKRYGELRRSHPCITVAGWLRALVRVLSECKPIEFVHVVCVRWDERIGSV